MDQRKNTVKVQLPEHSEKPLDVEVLKWVINGLKLKADEIVGLAQNPVNDGAIFIKCVSEDTMKEIIESHDGAVFRYENGTEVTVKLSVAAENVRYIRVFGLPFEVEDEHIAAYFGSYGKVKRLVKEKFPPQYNFDVLSGVRGVYIDLKKDVPTFLYIRGVRVKVHYFGMKERCHICGSCDHMKNECPKKPTPIVSPMVRIETMRTMTNLNDLFKKPNLDGRTAGAGGKAGAETGATVGASMVVPTHSFAAAAAGKIIPPTLPPNEEEKISAPAVEQPKQMSVTVTTSNCPAAGVSGSSTLSTPGAIVDEVARIDEKLWQEVKRSSRSREKLRVRTDSDSSTASTGSRGRGRPPKKQLVIQKIADYEIATRQKNQKDPQKTIPSEISDQSEMEFK